MASQYFGGFVSKFMNFRNLIIVWIPVIALFGWIATVVPRAYTYYISTALFAIFGLKMLKEGYSMSPTDAQEELEEVQSDLRKKEEEVSI